MSSIQKKIRKIAKAEIQRIFEGLHLKRFKKEQKYVFHKYKKIQPKFHQNSKYRNPKVLIPIIIYFCLRILDHRINKLELIKVAGMSINSFNVLPRQLQNYIKRKN